MLLAQDMSAALDACDTAGCSVTNDGMVRRQLGAEPYALERSSGWWWFYGILSMVSCGMSTYHGYRRHGTIPAALGWGLLGAIFPVITPAVALAQGFGQRKR